ncbi:kinase-like protein [Epithele typhae]|uniref:kinase-like protein n=1 Tax=Epithele typhae TaxID=378194 RepID=UPI0020082F5E|nr:kinase-like protein [Epithele typhae]KAH9931149.1 kinase-like protein [Epithele typhae]
MVSRGASSRPALAPLSAHALFSPALDSGDLSSDDGDSLHTPLTEHNDDALACLPRTSTDRFDRDGYLDSSPSRSPRLLAVPPNATHAFVASPVHEDPSLSLGRTYSERFHEDHVLNPFFVEHYRLEDELGAGGYGFVMTARQRADGQEVAVKFIIKDKVPEHAWWEDETFGRVPTEVMLLSLVNHENIVKCLDLFEDEVFFYLVQELHGTPWVSRKQKKDKRSSVAGALSVPPTETPTLSPSASVGSSIGSAPHTPLQTPSDADRLSSLPLSTSADGLSDPLDDALLRLPSACPPKFTRRASHDLFECIEQSKHKRLSEDQARYIFAQVVEAVYYLDSQGITHCDIKDENLVIDADLKVKLIDFGSAVVADPSRPRPYYTLFFGTTAYASSEILQKRPYQAPPAEVWTLGVLLSYLVTGHSPFPKESDAREGRIVIREPKSHRLNKDAIRLMTRCLEKDPELRADIHEVRNHPWVRGALDECD